MHRRRALIVGLNYPPEHTGIAPYTAALAKGIAKGFDVQVLTTPPHYPAWAISEGYGAWTDYRLEHGVEVRRLRHYVPGNPTGLSRIISEASFAARVAASKVDRPDVVVAVTPALLPVASALRIGRRWGVPVGVWVQDLYSKALEELNLLGGTAARGSAKLEGRLLRSASGIVAIHERMAETIERDFGITQRKIEVVKNWTHVSTPSADRAKTRAELGWEGRRIILHAGNMGAKQGLPHVIDAAKIAQRTRSDLHFVLVGDGSKRSELIDRARGVTSVEFMDSVDARRFPELLAAADALLLHEEPGIQEMCVPSKLTSYFAAGRPVIAATNAHGAAALEMERSGAGKVIQPGRPELIVDVAHELLSMDHIGLGRAAQAYARGHLSEDAALTKFVSWLDRLTV